MAESSVPLDVTAVTTVERNGSGKPDARSGCHLELFRQVYEDAPQAAGLVDNEGVVRHVNSRACALVGYELTRVAGIRLSEASWLWDSKQKEAVVLEAFARAMDGSASVCTTTCRVSSGSPIPVEMSVRPWRSSDGDVVGATFEVWDTSERVAVKKTLEQVRRTLEATLEQSPAAMIVVRADDGTVSHFNRAAVELLGCGDEPSYQGRPFSEFIERRTWQVFDADGHWVDSENRPLSLILGGSPSPEEEQRIVRKDGSSRWLLTRGTPIYDREGTLLAAVATIRDVTDEKEAVAQLRQRTEELRTILHTLRMGIVLLKQRRVEWANPAFLSMFGYREEEIFHDDAATFYETYEDYERVGREGYAELARGGFYSTRAVMKRKDRSVFLCDISGQAIDPANIAVGSIWVLRDVSEQQRQEDALRDTERKLAELFRASPAMIIVSHAETGRLIEFNEAFTRITGFGREEVLGRTSLEIGLWPKAAMRRQVIEQFRRNGWVRNYEARLCHKSGELLDVLMSGTAITIGGEQCLIWVIADITDYKRVEKLAREGEKRFLRLAEHSNDLIVVTDDRAIASFVVGPLTALWGYELDEILDRSLLEIAHPDDVESCRTTVEELREAPENMRRMEVRVLHHQGHYVVMEAVGCNWLSDPIIRGIVWNLREITERKQAEQERARLQEQLQQAMRMEAIGRLAGGVAHDFNNLLTVILGNLEIAEAMLAPSDPLGEPFGEIRKAAESAVGLTRQLLAFSRRQIVEPRTVDLNELIGSLRKMLGRIIGEDVELRVVLAERLGAVRIDPGQFDQVVINLVVNARDAMPNGGTLEIETLPAELDDVYCQAHPGTQPGTYAMLVVTDSGEGMSEEVKRRVFEPFFTTKPAGHGTGLGLAMIFGAVKQAGGTIEVYSEVGHGTTFKLYLPCIDGPAEPLALQAAALPLPRGDETVLLVEDEPSVRELATLLLRRLGYDVIVASHGEQALKLAGDYREAIHLLMTDVVMPGINGRELAERLRAVHPETQVLFASGYTEDVMIHHGVLTERLSFISKPYSMHALATKVRQALAQRRGVNGKT